MGRYATTADLRLALRAPTSSDARSWADTTFTDQLTRVIDTAERLVDAHCGWSFDAPASTDPVARTVLRKGVRWSGCYAPTYPIASADDVSVAADGQTVDDDRWWWGHEGNAGAQDAWRHIRLEFSASAPIVVTAVWGWPGGPPTAVKDATIMWAAHLFTLEATPLGAQAFDFGSITVAHRPRGVDGLLDAYRDAPGGVVVA